MHKIVSLPIAVLAATVLSTLSFGPATACRIEARPAIKYYVVPRPIFASKHTRQADRITTGSIDRRELSEEEKKRVEDCMAIWDAGTHMTKTQWRRTCRSLLGQY